MPCLGEISEISEDLVIPDRTKSSWMCPSNLWEDGAQAGGTADHFYGRQEDAVLTCLHR